MKRAEYNTVLHTLDNMIEREERTCKRYVELNPCEKDSRENDRDLIIMALCMAKTELMNVLYLDK